MPLAAVHSEYENFYVFKFLTSSNRAEKTERWGETKKKEKQSERVCCLVVWSRVTVKKLHLHASMPPLLPSTESLLRPVSRKCPPSWHTCTHTHPKNVGKTPRWARRMKTFNKSKLEVGQTWFSKDILEEHFFLVCQGLCVFSMSGIKIILGMLSHLLLVTTKAGAAATVLWYLKLG